jgi:hypothetical protein
MARFNELTREIDMGERENAGMTRQQWLRGGMRLAGAITVIALTGAAGSATAAKVAKSDFSYQPKPKDGKRCANCRLYLVEPDGKTGCAVVEGEVSPDGWCMAYSPKG